MWFDRGEFVGKPQSFRGHHCIDCGVPISAYSRGRCRQCGYIGLRRCVPEDFATVLRRLGSQGAAKFYRASLGTVTRWRREIGMRWQERAYRPSSSNYVRPKAFSERPLRQVRDFTLPGQAADYLRRYGSVYRCDVNGKPNAKGEHWRRNYSVLTDDQIVTTARKLGWEPFGT